MNAAGCIARHARELAEEFAWRNDRRLDRSGGVEELVDMRGGFQDQGGLSSCFRPGEQATSEGGAARLGRRFFARLKKVASCDLRFLFRSTPLERCCGDPDPNILRSVF